MIPLSLAGVSGGTVTVPMELEGRRVEVDVLVCWDGVTPRDERMHCEIQAVYDEGGALVHWPAFLELYAQLEELDPRQDDVDRLASLHLEDEAARLADRHRSWVGGRCRSD